ncbi:MAG: HAD family phosphatase [Clostridiales bacterium]|nr:HAD family phosphatase [Clostridiales bacterium]
MDYRLLITDLDGTLLRKDKSISRRTLLALEKCRRKGILVAFATARSEMEAKRFIEKVHPDMVILNGGAAIFHLDKMIYRKLLDRDTVKGIVDMCRELSQGEITVDADDGYYWNYQSGEDLDQDHAEAIYDDFTHFHRPAYKVTPWIEREEDAAKIAHAFPDCEMLSFTGECWRRFAAKGADKVSAIGWLSDYLGITMKQIIAFGDDYNDVGMLKAVGMGVAMENGIEEIKKMADAVTLSNEADGVAAYIEKHILEE